MASQANQPGGGGGAPTLDLQEFVKRHLAAAKVSRDRPVHYEVEELKELIAMSLAQVKEAPSALATANPPIVVVGDIHGQYFDLIRWFSTLGDHATRVPGWKRYKFMFLGDYVDRGRRSLECVCLVLTLRLLYPKMYTMLRGNHECKGVNRVYGFYDEILDRFDKDVAEFLWSSFNEIFSYLPLVGLIGSRVICMHGGISPGLNSLDDVRNIALPLEDVTTNPLAMDLLWADPLHGVKGFQPNKVRGVSVAFGEDEVHNTCKKLNLDLIIRGHQMMMEGHGFFANRRLITVFSAPKYQSDAPNKGAVVIIGREGKTSFQLMRHIEGNGEGPRENLPSEREMAKFVKYKESSSREKSASKKAETA